MGSANSTKACNDEQNFEDLWWHPVNNASKDINKKCATPESTANDEVDVERAEKRKVMAKELEDFKKNLHAQHEEKRQIIAARKQELADIRAQLNSEKIKNEELTRKLSKSSSKENTSCERCDQYEELLKENDEQKKEIIYMKAQMEKYEDIAAKNRNLQVNIVELQEELQTVNSEVLDFETERNEYKVHVTALKDVIKVSKEMLVIRENQIEELKQKVKAIDESLKDREIPLLAEDLRKEYERQLRNIRHLRTLYEERERMDRREKQNLASTLDDTKKLLDNEQKKNQEQEVRIEELEEKDSTKYDLIKNLESQLGLSKAECKELQSEMAVINQLFSQILLGFNSSQDVDLDELVTTLEENHDLLSKIAINEESTEISAALPKTLLDLVKRIKYKEKPEEDKQTKSGNSSESQENGHLKVDGKKTDEGKSKLETIVEENEMQNSNLQLSSAEEIVQNLPKVWKVLIELLSHQCVPINTILEETSKGNEQFCYNSVQTPNGTKLVLSVSKTFIRLKDLILEKKSLEKETNHLKHLNTHLETRLQDQEKRLETVSKELSKTWHVVGKMQKQHQQLHTQEKILRYELAQKRKLLTELKEELEYCREKWIQAREKNTSTELQWKELRKEFSERKPQIDASTESGYSDNKSSSDEESEFETTKDPEVESNKNSKDNDSTKTAVQAEGEVDMEQSRLKGDSTIIEVIQDAITNIAAESETAGSTNDVNHSVANTDKTDLVQSDALKGASTSKAGQSVNIEEMLARREERLQRMEQQGQELVNKVTTTSKKSVDICNKLGDLHEIYGESSRNDSQEVKEDSQDLSSAANNEDNEES